MRTAYNFLAKKLENHFRFDARYFLKGGFWLTIGQFASIVFGLVTTVLFAHFISESDYGVYRYLIGIAVILSSFSLTGLGQSILQTAAKKYYGFYQETLRLNFIYNLPIIGISLTGASYYWFNENNTLAIGCALVALLQPIINTFQFIPTFLIGSRRFKESTILNTLRIFTISIASIVALFITQNILILFVVYLVGYLTTNVISHLIFHPKISVVPKDIVDKYISYAKHTSVRSLIGNIAYRLDTIIIFTQLGAVDLAIYSIANVIPEQIKNSLKNLSSLLLPKYANHTDPAQLKKSVPKRSLQLLLLLIIITFLYISIAPLLFSLLFPKYEGAILLSQLVALSFPATIAIIPFSIIQAQIKEAELHKINIWSSVMTLGLTIVLVYTFGLIGAIVARVISRYFNLALSYFYLYRN